MTSPVRIPRDELTQSVRFPDRSQTLVVRRGKSQRTEIAKIKRSCKASKLPTGDIRLCGETRVPLGIAGEDAHGRFVLLADVSLVAQRPSFSDDGLAIELQQSWHKTPQAPELTQKLGRMLQEQGDTYAPVLASSGGIDILYQDIYAEKS